MYRRQTNRNPKTQNVAGAEFKVSLVRFFSNTTSAKYGSKNLSTYYCYSAFLKVKLNVYYDQKCHQSPPLHKTKSATPHATSSLEQDVAVLKLRDVLKEMHQVLSMVGVLAFHFH